MESNDLSNLASRVERLTNSLGGKAVNQPCGSLAVVMEQGNRLWKHTAARGVDEPQMQRSSLMLEAQGVTIPSIPEVLFESGKVTEQPYNYLSTRREQMITNTMDEAIGNILKFDYYQYVRQRMAKWRQAYHKMQATSAPEGLFDAPAAQPGESDPTNVNSLKTAFAKEVSSYVTCKLHGGVCDNLMAKFCQLAMGGHDKTAREIWTTVSLLNSVINQLADPINVSKTSSEYKIAFASVVQSHMEKVYRSYITKVVLERLEIARLGGLDDTYSLVHAYLNVIMPVPYAGYEDVLISGHPVWAVILCCLRCGDVAAARRAVESAGPSLAQYCQVFAEFASKNLSKLSDTTELKLRLQWQRSVRLSSDRYKQSVFCSLITCDPDQMYFNSQNVEDWIWIRIRQVYLSEVWRVDSTPSDNKPSFGLDDLQRLVSVTCGEAYFTSANHSLIYFNTLWLSGQFEAAVEFIHRSDGQLHVHAVHMALALYELGLLNVTYNYSGPLLTLDDDDNAAGRRLNFVQLILRYCGEFQAKHPREAVDYYYFLKDFKNFDGSDMFSVMFTRLVLANGEYKALLGYVDNDGTVKPGLADKFGMMKSTIIQTMAKSALQSSRNMLAAELYDLSGDHGQVAKILADAMCSQLLEHGDALDALDSELFQKGLSIYKRYSAVGDEENASAVQLVKSMLDLNSFFEAYSKKRHSEAFMILTGFKCIPLASSELEAAINKFSTLPEQMRQLINKILVALMNILVEDFRHLSKSKSERSLIGVNNCRELKEMARVIINYAGSIPHRLSSDTTSRLIQMEVSML